jgi:hypothetical protein
MRRAVALILVLSLTILTGCSYGALARLNPAVAELEEKIKGRENEPAEQVFQNIQVLKGMPAGRVLDLMIESFSPALGVRCGHCHVDGHWHLDDKDPKRIAREMWTMTGNINSRVREIVDPEARVHCATCHQGQKTPPLEVD